MADTQMTSASKKPATMQEYINSTLAEMNTTVRTRGLVLPKNYSATNALSAAFLAIQQVVDKDKRPALSVCTPESVKQSLLEMVLYGLTPAKKQVYFIVFGNKLTLLTSYFGEVARAKASDPTIMDIYAEIVYRGDNFKYRIKNGYKEIVVHEQDPANIKGDAIMGAYATIVYENGREVSDFMTIEQIHNSWARGQTKGQSDAHKLAPEEMCRKTVLRRLSKRVYNTSDDAEVMAELDETEQDLNERENTKDIDIVGDETVGSAYEPEAAKEPEQTAAKTEPDSESTGKIEAFPGA